MLSTVQVRRQEINRIKFKKNVRKQHSTHHDIAKVISDKKAELVAIKRHARKVARAAAKAANKKAGNLLHHAP